MKRLIGLLCLLVLTVATGAQAQAVRERGLQRPRFQEATAAGVESYSLTTVGSDLAKLEIFGPSSVWIANCEMEWSEGTTTTTCAFDSGHYRITWDWGSPGGRSEALVTTVVLFEDLITAETSKVTATWKKSPRGLITLQPGESPPKPEVRFEYEGMGADRIGEKRSRCIEVMSALSGEVETTLGRHRAGQPLQRMLPRSPTQQPPATPQSNEQQEIENVFLCGDGALPECNTSQGFSWTAIGSSHSSCCAVASSEVDTDCKLATGTGCCANSLCSSQCNDSGPTTVCVCSLFGYIFTCPPPCV